MIDKKAPTSGIFIDDRLKLHETGYAHPESAVRLDAVRNALDASHLLSALVPIPSRAATEEEVLLVHTRDYIETVKKDIDSGVETLSTGDTVLSKQSLMAANVATGGVLNAVDAVYGSKLKRVFCVLRPPGHHATPARGMGFCIWNHIAIAARYAQRKHGISRVLIVDWDVHHGNGTQDTFYRDDSVLFFSTHQHPWYPGTGSSAEMGDGQGKGFTINCPFPAGAGREEILGAMEEKLLPAAEKFQPELVLISAGFDSRRDDPLGQFLLEDEDFAEMTRVIGKIARKSAQGRIISLLEGGYHLPGLASAAVAHVTALSSLPD